MLGSLVIKALVGTGLLFWIMMYFNHLNGVKFKSVLKRLEASPEAEGRYYGDRALSIAIVIAGVSVGSLL